ncbi:hypothetical protein Zmor_008001 [Zophobas morio]|uniref:DUF7064 domain-containing protein n=1 Tax=Zophobas morio TaxID=2755281 RepID=A0AA38MQ44_9CUCU|nr:hypothetical protein Zmor_008001 [Zophobas morio]
MLAIALTLLVLAATLYLHTRKSTPQKIFNVYSQPGKWFHLKYASFLVLLWTRRLAAKLSPPLSVKKLETMKPLSEHEKAFDATFFQAVSKNGFYFCGGIERRHRAKANGLFYIAVPELGLLESLKLPNTLLDADPASVLLMKEYSAEGICFTPVEPMKKWRVAFNGKMRVQASPSKLVDVKLSGDWTSSLPYFFFENDMSAKCLAKAIACETWSDDFFKTLKSAHQTHYEQMGFFSGTLSIDNKIYTLQMDAFRDHSYGYKRDWTLMHRYVFHMLYLENGTRVSIGLVSQPATTSLLLMGYVVPADKSIHCIENCDLVLYQHGENGTPGKNYAFCFETDNETYDAKINVIYEAFHFKGNNTEAKLIERFIECEVNGVKGKGVSEWHYNTTRT